MWSYYLLREGENEGHNDWGLDPFALITSLITELLSEASLLRN
jgi:hypothetical protein